MAPADQQTSLVQAIRGCASWQDIQAKWRTFPEKQKGALFEELVKAYSRAVWTAPCCFSMRSRGELKLSA